MKNESLFCPNIWIVSFFMNLHVWDSISICIFITGISNSITVCVFLSRVRDCETVILRRNSV